jgi:hypothetical protein
MYQCLILIVRPKLMLLLCYNFYLIYKLMFKISFLFFQMLTYSLDTRVVVGGGGWVEKKTARHLIKLSISEVESL